MIDLKLAEYANSDIYPFHMPGHKRQMNCLWNPYEIDITEIEGFDNLHHASDILKEAQDRAAELYGSKKAYYLVNGSTCGILAAICAATAKGDQVLVARNCHKAVYHAIYLHELVPEYIYPEITRQGIQGQMQVESIRQALKKNSKIKAVVITSPTYDGVVSDIKSIAEVVHQYGIPLIVDEAHGASFGMSKDVPVNAIQCGADVVIVSVHKTLPAFTQTALLHICSERVSQKKIEKYLGIFETSSPSYILMAGIERCVRFMTENKDELFPIYIERLQQFYKQVENLKCLRVIRGSDFSEQEAFDFDESKILIFTDDTGISGKELHDELLHQYGIELEMVAGNYVLALSSIMDTQEGFNRLAKAIIEIDKKLQACAQVQEKKQIDVSIYQRMERSMEIHEAENARVKMIELKDSSGRISADYVYLYPPGIPLIVPGEKITEQLICDVQSAIEIGLDVEGLADDQRINVVNRT